MNMIAEKNYDFRMQGEAGNDIMEGGTDGDGLVGGASDDNMDGDAGDDTLVGDNGDDFLDGDAGFVARGNGGLGFDTCVNTELELSFEA